MRMASSTEAHLTYCLNVYPVKTFQDIKDNVFQRAASVFENLRRKRSREGPYGLGLWIPASIANELQHGEAIAQFKERLDHNSFYAFTINGFPYGQFHGGCVKEKVYSPDWSTPERYQYTVTIAKILAGLIPEGIEGTVSTVPVTYKAWVKPLLIDTALTHLMDVAADFERIRKDSGKDIVLALEPEPGCLLAGTNDVVNFFSNVLHSQGAKYLEKRYGYDSRRANEVIRQNIGVCLDTVHSAVMFEDPRETLKILASNNIRVAKVHLGAAISVKVGETGPPPSLKEFNDNVYLHQVTIRKDSGAEIYFSDLPEAFQSLTLGEWRVHFHVPLSGNLKETLGTTAYLVNRDFIQTALDTGVRHFEVETYTLNVLPGFEGTIEDTMANELGWVMERFSRPSNA